MSTAKKKKKKKKKKDLEQMIHVSYIFCNLPGLIGFWEHTFGFQEFFALKMTPLKMLTIGCLIAILQLIRGGFTINKEKPIEKKITFKVSATV